MMKKENFIWENETFQKDPFKVPDGYFSSFPDRVMERIYEEDTQKSNIRHLHWKHWMSWVSGAAAVLLVGWLGVHNVYRESFKEVTYQEKIELFVDFCGGELHEGQIATYLEDNSIDLKSQSATDVNELIQIEPELTEEYIYESVGY